MPNIDYDPQNPTDLMDRPIAEGDIVAWGTTYGRSPAICVGRIEKIRFFRRDPNAGRYHGGANVDCDRASAEGYQIRLLPIRSTGSVTDTKVVWDPQAQKWDLADIPPKVKTIHIVKNIVKLEAL